MILVVPQGTGLDARQLQTGGGITKTVGGETGLLRLTRGGTRLLEHRDSTGQALAIEKNDVVKHQLWLVGGSLAPAVQSCKASRQSCFLCLY